MANPNTQEKVIITLDGTFTDNGAVGGTNKKLQLAITYEDVKDLKYSKKGWFTALKDPVDSERYTAGGTALIYKTQRNITQNYRAGSGPNDIAGMDSVECLIDLKKENNVEFETLDLSRLEVITATEQRVDRALVSKYQMSLEIGKNFYLGTKALSGMYKVCYDNGITDININVAKKGDTLPTQEEALQTIWNTMIDTKFDFQTLITDNILGINTEDVIALVSPQVVKYLITATTLIGSDNARESLLSGNLTNIAGINIALTNQLGKKYLAGVVDKNEAFDFTTLDIIITTKEAYFFPWVNTLPTSTAILPNTRNPYTLTKYAVSNIGGVPIYPELFKGFKIKLVEPTK